MNFSSEPILKLIPLDHELIVKALNGELEAVIDCIKYQESNLFSNKICLESKMNNNEREIVTSDSGVCDSSNEATDCVSDSETIIQPEKCVAYAAICPKELIVKLVCLTESEINEINGRLSKVDSKSEKVGNVTKDEDNCSKEIETNASDGSESGISDSDSTEIQSTIASSVENLSTGSNYVPVYFKPDSEEEAKSDFYSDAESNPSVHSSFTLSDSQTDSSSEDSSDSDLVMETECLKYPVFSPLYLTNCFYCDFCDMQTLGFVELKKHREDLHSHLFRIPCLVCGVSFETDIQCKGHIEQQHTNSEKYRCNLCGIFKESILSLNNHITMTHRNQKKSKCKHCGDYFRSSKFVNEHIKFTHFDIRRRMKKPTN